MCNADQNKHLKNTIKKMQILQIKSLMNTKTAIRYTNVGSTSWLMTFL